MPEINLLPEDQKAKGYATQISVSAKKLGKILGVIALIGLLTYAGINIYYFITSSITKTSTLSLETQIKALEPTEQKIVLLKDRINKSSKIFASPTSLDEAKSFLDIVSQLPEGVTVGGAKIEPDQFTISINSDESGQITEFIRVLTTSKKYPEIKLLSMTFTPQERYKAELKLMSKSETQ